MKTQLSIILSQDAIFQRAILKLNCSAVCIRQDVDSNRYEVTYSFPSDLFYLGITMGMKATQEIYTKAIWHPQKSKTTYLH